VRKRDVKSRVIVDNVKRRRSGELLVGETPFVLARPLHIDRNMNRLRSPKLRDSSAHVRHDIGTRGKRKKNKDKSGEASHGRRVCVKQNLKEALALMLEVIREAKTLEGFSPGGAETRR
jgi:hypothetical protein